jgi:xanthine dehydrogenase molybdopterin-binding subunit B
MKLKHDLKVVGTNAQRVDAIEKVSGKAIYTSDIQLPGMAHARILRSPVAHAKLVKVDAPRQKNSPVSSRRSLAMTSRVSILNTVRLTKTKCIVAGRQGALCR